MVEIISGLNNAEKLALAPKLNKRSYRKGAKILSYKNSGSSLMFVVEGDISVSRISSSGKKVELARIHQGDFFGEIALLTGQPRAADVIAETPCTIYELNRADFVKHIKRYHGLLLALSCHLAERLSHSTNQIANLAFCDVSERVFAALWQISEHVEGETRRIVRDRPTQQQLADEIGSAREVVARAFATLEEAGRIEIIDRSALWIR